MPASVLPSHQPAGQKLPEAYDQFVKIATRLENHYRDMQDMEFTIEDGKLFMLQTRNGKRTAQAALQIACDLVDEGMSTEQKRLFCAIEPRNLDTLLHPQFDAAALKAATPMGKGLAASPALPAARSSSPLTTPRLEGKGREGRPGPSGDLSRGHRRHEGISGYPDGPRRYDHPRCRCCPWYGYLLCIRLRRRSSWTRRTRSSPWPARPSTRATSSPSTAHRQHLRRRHPDRGRFHRRQVRPHHGLGR